MTLVRTIRGAVLAFLPAVFPLFAGAAITDYSILIDADNDVATGCTVLSMPGVDHVLVTRVVTSESDGTVTRTHRQACVAGLPGAEVELGNGWDVGFQPASGQMLVETALPFSAFGGVLPANMRIGVVAQQGSTIHSAQELPNGNPVLFPAPVRRRAVGTPGGLRTIALDGDGADWNGLDALFDGIAESGSPGLRMLKVFAYADVATDTLFFRIDANVSTDAPFATDDEYARTQGEPELSVASPGVLANDGDPNGLPLTAMPVSPAAHGTVTLNPDGSFTYTPNDPASSQNDVFEYQANNGTKSSNAAQVRIEVTTDSESDPVAGDDAYGTNEDEALSIAAPGVLANDTDPNGDPLTAALLAIPAHGTVVLHANGGFTYTPDDDFFGADSFTYEVSDGANTDTATVTITIASVNDQPRINADSFTIPENSPDGTIVGTVDASDADTGDDQEFTIIGGNTGNAFAINDQTGRITVANSAAVDFETTPQFLLTVRVRDDGSPRRSDSATITVNLTDINEAPVAVADAFATGEDTPLNVPAISGVLVNDSDAEGTPITATLVADVTNGALALNADGSFSYTPNANFNGSDSFTYRVSDGVFDSNVVTVTITVNAVNDAPVFTTGGNVATDEDTPFNAAWATGISAGPADEAAQILTFNVTIDTNAALFASGPSIDAAGVLTFTPALNANGTADITVVLTDNGGGTNASAPVMFQITVNAVNDAPVNSVPGDQALLEDVTLLLNAGAGNVVSITDVDAGAANVEVTLTATNGLVDMTSTTGLAFSVGDGTYAPTMTFQGTVAAINAAIDELSFQPTAEFFGVATLAITTNDLGNTPAPAASDTDTITINVAPDNDAPVAVDDAYNVDEGATLNEAAPGVLTNDSDVEGPMSAVKVTDPANGTLTLNADGSFVYTHDGSETLTDSFTYKVNDGVVDSSTVTVTITINPVNDPPVAVDDAYSTDEDTALTTAPASVLDNDTDGDGTASVAVLVTGPANAAAFTLNPDGTFTYTPNADFNGTDTFTYLANDGVIDSVAPATVTITVNAINDEPSFAIDTPPTSIEDGGAESFTNVVTALTAGPLNEASQTLTFTLTPTGTTGDLAFSAGPSMASDGTLTYTSAPNTFGTATYDVFVTDSGGTAVVGDDDTSPTLAFTITVNGVNDAPVVTSTNTVGYTEGAGPIVLNSGITVVDVDSSLQSASVQVSGNADGGDILACPACVGLGLTPSYSAGSWTLSITGNASPSVYETALRSVTYDSSSDAPLLAQRNIDWFVMDASAVVSLDTAANDTQVDITAVNDAPVNNLPASQNVDEDAPLVFTGANAITISDPDAASGAMSTTLTVVNGILTASAGATITDNGTTMVTLAGTLAEINTSLDGLTFTPDAEFAGGATIAFNTTDNGNTGTGGALVDNGDVLNITVVNVNDAPINTVPATQTVDEDSTDNAIAGLLVDDIDADVATEVTISVTNGTLSLGNTTGLTFNPASDATDETSMTFQSGLENLNNRLATLTFTPDANFFGTAVVTIVSSDLAAPTAATDTDTFDITVSPINDEPSFTKGADVIVLEDSGAYAEATWATALNAGPNEGAQTLSFNVSNDNNGLFSVQPSVDATGQLTFTPAADINGSATVTISISDDGGTAGGGDDTSANQTFMITVTAVNDTPSFTKGADQTVLEDSGANTQAGWATALSAGPADEAAQTLSFNVANDNNALFSVQPAVDAAGELTYTLAADVFGSATVTISISDNGGTANGGSDTSADQTFTITVTNVNDEPGFTKGADVTVLEDSGAATEAGWATALSAGPNEGSQTLSFNVSNDNNPLFSVQPAVASDGTLTFTPAANANGAAAVTLSISDNGGTANSGDDTSADQTFTITVTAVNDTPSFTKGVDQTVLEDSGAATVAGWATALDAGPADESAQTFSFNVANDNNALFSVQPAVDAAGQLTYTPAADVFGSATITISISDNGGTANGGSDTSADQTFTITVTNVNDEPSFTKGSDVTVSEDSGAYTEATWATALNAGPNEASQTLSFNVSNDDNTLFSTQPSVDPSGQLTFTPAANMNGSATVTISISDNGGTADSGDDTSADQTFTITVTAVNDAPSFIGGADVSIDEDHGAFSEAAWATGLSAGPADESSQGLMMQSNVTGTTGTLTFSTPPSVNVVSGDLTFQANPNTCGTATVDITLTDDAGTPGVPADDLSSAPHTLTITVACVNDAPTFTMGGDQSVPEDSSLQTVNPWATAISPGPGETDALTFNISNDNNSLFSVQPAVSAAGVLTYTPAADANGTATVTISLSDDAGTPGVPADDLTTADETFTISVTAVNDVPTFTVQEPAFIVLGTTGPQTSTVATAIDAGAVNEAAQILTFDVTGNTNPALFLAGPTVAADGTLSWEPASGVDGTSLITITLTDDNETPGVPADDETSAGQSFTVAVERAPTVDATAPLEGAMTVMPGDDIVVTFSEEVAADAGAFALDCSGVIAVTHNASPATVYTIEPSVAMPGGPCTFTIESTLIHDTDSFDPPDELAADFTLTFTVNTPPTAVDDNTTALGHVTLTVADAQGVLVNDTDPDAGFDLHVDGFGTPMPTTAGGTITFTEEGGYTYNAQALDQNLTDTVTYTVMDQHGGTDTGTLSINLGSRFIYVDDDHATVTPDGRDIHPWKTLQQAQAGSSPGDTILVKSGSYGDHIILQSSQSLIGQGITLNHTHTHNSIVFTVLTPAAAPTINRAVAGDTITLATNNTIRGVTIGSTLGRGIVGNTFGTLTVNDNVSVSANGSSALHLDTGAVTATFNSVSASAGANPGLTLNALTGTLNINGGTISNTAGATLAMTGGSVAGTIAANLSTSGTSLVNIASRTANALTLSGALSGSGTIAASSNAAGTTLTFSGTQTLTTGGNNGVSLTSNDGTVSFTGGALQITATTGRGLVATGALGEVNVTGATNTITTLTGIPMQISGGVDIGASGITFRSISSNGSTSGIFLADTGVNPFTVTGTGTAGTGGTLQGIVGTGVTLTNTTAVNLSHMNISGATGIAGTTFGTLTLRDLAVNATAGLVLHTGTVNNAPAANAFTSLNTSGGTHAVTMTSVEGTFNVLAGTLTGATGPTFRVNGGTVGGTWSTNVTQANNAAVIDVSNGHNGSLTFAGTVSATNGTGLQFSNADGNYNFSGAATLSGGAGIDVLAASAGTFTWDGDSSIANTTGQLVDIQASTPAFTYSGTFTKTNAGIGIRALNNTGGSITFNGTGTKNITINSGAANAIDLDNNDNTTIAFSGNNLTLSTLTGNAFHAINGGTVTVTGTGNTIASSGGKGVNVADTLIGTADLNFQSVNTNGGANGIVLSNTGTSAASNGGIIVAGTGAANSGGTLQNHSGDAVLLLNARDISFTQMNVLTSTGSHIDATNVTNLTLNTIDFDLSTDHGIVGSNVRTFNADNCTFDRGGAGNAGSGKHGIFMTNLMGTSSVTDSTFTRSNTIQFFVTNTSATVAQPAASQDVLTLSHNTWNQHTGAFGGDHFSLLAAVGSNMRLVVNGTGGENKTGGLLAAGSNEGGNAYNIQATNGGKIDSSVTAVDAMNVTSGVNIAASTGGINVYDVFSNKTANGTGFASHGIMALNVACINSTCTGKLRDNSISHTAPANVNAINIVQEGSGTNTVEVSNNVVNGSFQHGIKVHSRQPLGGSGTTSATILNNTLTQTSNLGLDVINVEAGASGGGHSATICLNMAGNTATIAPGGTNAYRLRAWPNCTLNMQDFTGNGMTLADVQAWVTTTKSNSGLPVAAQYSGGTFQAAGAACPTP